MIREAFAANLLRATTFPYRMDQLNAVGINDAQHGRSSQEDLGPVLMGLQKTKEPRPLGQAGKQRPIVARQPAREGTIPDAFERMQEPERHHLTGPEVRLGVFGDGAQLLIDLIEQGSDKLRGAHTALLSWEGCHREQRGGVVDRLQGQKRELLVCTALYPLYSWQKTNTIGYYAHDEIAPCCCRISQIFSAHNASPLMVYSPATHEHDAKRRHQPLQEGHHGEAHRVRQLPIRSGGTLAQNRDPRRRRGCLRRRAGPGLRRCAQPPRGRLGQQYPGRRRARPGTRPRWARGWQLGEP